MATPRHITSMQRRVAPVPLPRATDWGHPETVEERRKRVDNLRYRWEGDKFKTLVNSALSDGVLYLVGGLEFYDNDTVRSILRRKRIG